MGGCSDVRAALLHCVHEAVHRDVKGVRYADHGLATPLLCVRVCVCVCVCVWVGGVLCSCACMYVFVYAMHFGFMCVVGAGTCVVCCVVCISRTYRQQMQDDIEGPNDVRPHLRRE